MSDDEPTLLQCYRESRSEAAFNRIVAHHVDHVYSTALRRTGRAALAQEVTQAVFSELARKAATLAPTVILGGWLHRCALLKASEALRAESRRRRHETEAAAMQPQQTEHAAGPDAQGLWQDLAPVLDEALDRLPAADRDALILRFYERRNLREVGAALGATEDTAQKRISRAVEKLRAHLARRGITGTASAISAALAVSVVKAAPGGFASALTATACSQAPAVQAGLFDSLTQSFIAMSAKTKVACIAVCICAGIITPIVLQQRTIARQEDLIRDLQNRLAAGTAGTVKVAGSTQSAQSASRLGPSSSGNAPASVTDLGDLAQVLREPDPVKRLGALAALLQSMEPDKAPAMGQLFREKLAAGSSLDQEYQLFLRAWGGLDGQAAMRFALETNRTNTEDAKAAIAGWAARNPSAAAQWLEANPQGKNTEMLAAGIAQGWSSLDLDAAARWVETRPRSDARTEMLEHLFRRYVETQGIDGAVGWFGKIDPAEHNNVYRQRVYDEIALHLAKNDPARALSWLEQHAGQQYAREGSAVAAVIKARAATDPQGAAEWAAAHPDIIGNHGPGTALSAAIEVWVSRDPNAAGRWLSGHTHSQGYDQAASAFVHGMAGLDPESGWAWANTIRDPLVRADSVQQAGREWMKADPETARTVLAAAGVPEEQLKSYKDTLASQALYELAFTEAKLNSLQLDRVKADVDQTLSREIRSQQLGLDFINAEVLDSGVHGYGPAPTANHPWQANCAQCHKQ